MQGCLQVAERVLFDWIAASPLDRWAGARRALPNFGGAGLWVLLVLGVLLVAAGVGAILWVRRQAQMQDAWAAFDDVAEVNGLCEEERSLLARIAKQARLKDPTTVMTSEETFSKGLGGILARSTGGTFTKASAGSLCGGCVFLFTLRQKLGFPIPMDQMPTASSVLQPIAVADKLTVVRQNTPSDFEVTVVKKDVAFPRLIVRPDIKVDVDPGESWAVRYPHDGMLCEFSATVVEMVEDDIVLKPVGTVRRINRRRFVRVPADKQAYVARFPFVTEANTREVPQFVPGKLVEFGGPGIQLQIEADLDVQESDSVLVVLELGPNKTIEGLGKVRRGITVGRDGARTFALELVGLSTAEVAELAKETNAIRRRYKPGEGEQVTEEEPEVVAAS